MTASPQRSVSIDGFMWCSFCGSTLSCAGSCPTLHHYFHEFEETRLILCSVILCHLQFLPKCSCQTTITRKSSVISINNETRSFPIEISKCLTLWNRNWQILRKSVVTIVKIRRTVAWKFSQVIMTIFISKQSSMNCVTELVNYLTSVMFAWDR